MIEGRSLRMRFPKQGQMATFHCPHPAKEAKPYQVEDVRHFLQSWESPHELALL